MTPSNINCFVNIHEVKSESASTASSSSIPVCNIEFHILFRYQLKYEINNIVIVLEDIVTPEHRTSVRIPIIFPLSTWREHYLGDALKPLNLDASVVDFLKKKIADAAVLLNNKNKNINNNDNKGFGMMVELGILKCEFLGKEEADRIGVSIKNEDMKKP